MGQRSGFRNKYLVAYAALVVFIMDFESYRALNDFAVFLVLYVLLDSDDDGLIHLVADDNADSVFSQISFFTHDISPLFP
jgi:hypothetical protein